MAGTIPREVLQVVETASQREATELALAALDPESDVDAVDMVGGMEELKRRLEVLLGAKPDAPVDESEKARQTRQAERLARREKVALAGGQLLGAALSFLSELLPPQEATDASRQMARAMKERLAECMETDDRGRLKLTVTLPDGSTLDSLADSLARLASARG